MSVAEWGELIKAIGGAVGAIIGAVGLAYARIAAKQAKQTVAQTSTTEYIDGRIRRKSAAETSEEAIRKADGLQNSVDTLIGRLARIELEIAARPGSGTRRAVRQEEHHEAL